MAEGLHKPVLGKKLFFFTNLGMPGTLIEQCMLMPSPTSLLYPWRKAGYYHQFPIVFFFFFSLGLPWTVSLLGLSLPVTGRKALAHPSAVLWGDSSWAQQVGESPHWPRSPSPPVRLLREPSGSPALGTRGLQRVQWKSDATQILLYIGWTKPRLCTHPPRLQWVRI